jgi:ATP-dependent Lon protease
VLSRVKNYAYDLSITNRRSEDPLKIPEPNDIHLHRPADATRKDGSNADAAMVCVLLFYLSSSFSFGCSSVVQDSDPSSV